MWRNTGKQLLALAFLAGVLFAAAAHGAPSARAAQNPSPAPALSKKEIERGIERRALYQKFLDNFRGGPAEQKAAYETVKKYLKKFGKDKDPDNVQVVDYLRRWGAKYEKAAAEYERRKKDGMGVGPGLGPGLPPQGMGTGTGQPPPEAKAGDAAPPADKQPAPATNRPKPLR